MARYEANLDFQKVDTLKKFAATLRAAKLLPIFSAVLRATQHGLYTSNLLPTPMFFGAQQLTAVVSVHIMVDFEVCFLQELGMTLMMKMTFVLATEFTCESPNLQTGFTNMYGHHNLHFSAWSLLEGEYSLSTCSLQPSHWSFTITFLFVHLLIVYLLCNCKHSLLSFIILWPHCISQQLQLWISYTL